MGKIQLILPPPLEANPKWFMSAGSRDEMSAKRSQLKSKAQRAAVKWQIVAQLTGQLVDKMSIKDIFGYLHDYRLRTGCF